MDLKIKHSIFDLATFGKENDSDDDSLPYGYLKKLDHGSYLKSALHDFSIILKFIINLTLILSEQDIVLSPMIAAILG